MHVDEDTIINTHTGERIVFTKRTADGSALGFDFYARPGGGVPFEHYHGRQTELFRMVSGELTICVEGERRVLRPGDELVLQPRTRHSLINEGQTEAHCYVEYEPALNSEWWFRVIHPYQSAIGREPTLLELAPFLSNGVEVFPANVPYGPGRVVIFLAGLLARLLGKKRKVLRIIEEHYGAEAARRADC